MKEKIVERIKAITVLAIMIMSSIVNTQAQKIQKVGVLVAMEKEYDLLRECEADNRVVVRQCGIGKVNAAATCVEMIKEKHPDVIVTIGCAGGNGDNIHVGDVVVSTETAYHDVYCGEEITYGQVQGMPARYATPQWLVDAACKVDADVSKGLVVSGDWFVDNKEKMQSIIEHFPEAKAIEMESAAIAQVCYRYNVPFVAIRIISDIPLSDEHGSQYAGFWSNVGKKTFSIAENIVHYLQGKNIGENGE